LLIDRPSRTTPTCSRQCFDQRSALDIEVAAHRRLRHAAIERGDFTNLSERKLMDCLNRLGYDIEIKVRPAAEPIGHLTLATA
jgi:hypothetical protein